MKTFRNKPRKQFFEEFLVLKKVLVLFYPPKNIGKHKFVRYCFVKFNLLWFPAQIRSCARKQCLMSASRYCVTIAFARFRIHRSCRPTGRLVPLELDRQPRESQEGRREKGCGQEAEPVGKQVWYEFPLPGVGQSSSGRDGHAGIGLGTLVNFC